MVPKNRTDRFGIYRMPRVSWRPCGCLCRLQNRRWERHLPRFACHGNSCSCRRSSEDGSSGVCWVMIVPRLDLLWMVSQCFVELLCSWWTYKCPVMRLLFWCRGNEFTHAFVHVVVYSLRPKNKLSFWNSKFVPKLVSKLLYLKSICAYKNQLVWNMNNK